MDEERILGGRYEVGDLIGRGGMADVHLGRDIILGRQVAIKLLRKEMARDPMLHARFRREAKAVAGLNHPNIVAVFDTGEMESDGAGDPVFSPFIVMEYVAGRTLREMIKSGEMTPALAVEYTLGVLDALGHSHRQGIVHRDIKPANVMVTESGGIKVMDFGIARALADASSTMTQTQAVVGTAQYLSPEQARGEIVDARTDLYSTGCLFYELLTGRPPFVGDSPVSVAYQHVGEQAPTPSTLAANIPELYDEVVLKALAKDRENRFADACAFSTALRNAAEGNDLPLSERVGTHVGPMAVAPIAYAAEPRLEETVLGLPPAVDDGYAQPSPDDWQEEPLWAAEDPREQDRRAYEASRRRAWITVSSVVLVLALAVGAWFAYSWAQTERERNALIEIPSVTSMTQLEAQNVLTALTLRPQIEEVFDDDVADGRAIKTLPLQGEQVRKDSEVQLLISKGPGQQVIPKDLVGQSEPAVRDELAKLGLVVGSMSTVNDPTIPADRLISTMPKLGAKVKTGSSVDLVLSTGKVTVPRLSDMTEDEARKLLSDPKLGLLLDVREEENSVVEPGTITGQLPAGNSDIAQGGTVVVTVAKAPPPPEPTPEPTPSPDPSTDPGTETPTAPQDPVTPPDEG